MYEGAYFCTPWITLNNSYLCDRFKTLSYLDLICVSLLSNEFYYFACWVVSVMSNSVTPWIVACQASLSMEFSRQEYWSGLPFPSPGDLPDPGIEPRSLALQGDSLPSEPPGKLLRLVRWTQLEDLSRRLIWSDFLLKRTNLTILLRWAREAARRADGELFMQMRTKAVRTIVRVELVEVVILGILWLRG